MAICEGSVTGSAEDMKGLGLWFGDSVNWCWGEPPKFSATTGAPPFMFIKGEPPFVIEYESLVQPSLPTGEVGRRLVWALPSVASKSNVRGAPILVDEGLVEPAGVGSRRDDSKSSCGDSIYEPTSIQHYRLLRNWKYMNAYILVRYASFRGRGDPLGVLVNTSHIGQNSNSMLQDQLSNSISESRLENIPRGYVRSINKCPLPPLFLYSLWDNYMYKPCQASWAVL